MANRDKRTAFWAMTLGVVVLVAVGVTSKDWVLETWYLHELEHGDEAEKRAAAEKLGEMGSVRAIPGLFEALKDSESSSVRSVVRRIATSSRRIATEQPLAGLSLVRQNQANSLSLALRDGYLGVAGPCRPFSRRDSVPTWFEMLQDQRTLFGGP